MWWSEDEDPRLAYTIEDLAGLFTERGLPGVTAVGSSWDGSGERTLYLGVELGRDRRAWSWAPNRGGLDALTRSMIERFGPLPPLGFFDRGDKVLSSEERPRPARTARARFAAALRELVGLRAARRPLDGLATIPIAWADSETQAQLASLDIPPNTRIGYIGSVIEASGRGVPVWPRSEKPGALGCTLEAAGKRYATTAGHVETVNGLLRYPSRKRSGAPDAHARVIASTAPGRPGGGAPPGLDLAIAELTADPPFGRQLPVPGIVDPQTLNEYMWLVYNGAKTGHRRSYVSALANVAGNPPHLHTHLVQVTGRPGKGAANQGDSGTAVFGDDGQLVGHLVAVAGLRDGAAMQIGFVQHAQLGATYLNQHLGPAWAAYGDLGQR